MPLEIERKTTNQENYQSQQLRIGRWVEGRKKARPFAMEVANGAVIEDGLGRVSPKQVICSPDPAQDDPLKGKMKMQFV